MKKLITAKDIQSLVREGKKVCYAEEGSLVTPMARDEARTAGIEILSGAPVEAAPARVSSGAAPGIDSEMIYKMLKAMADKGMLGGILDGCSSGAAYAWEQDPTGLKVIRGGTVKLEPFFPDEPDKKVYYQELIDKNSSSISSGILVIDHSTYEWTQNYDENDYVIEGTLVVTINGRSYTANAGDCLFIPNGATVVMGSRDHCCKVFYNAYPSNWADLA